MSDLYGAQLAVLSMQSVEKAEQALFWLGQHPTATGPVKKQVYWLFVHDNGLSRLASQRGISFGSTVQNSM